MSEPDRLARRLVRLYPRAWRDRYEEEFVATVGDGPLYLQQVIDIVAGAIDARVSFGGKGTNQGVSRMANVQGGLMAGTARTICVDRKRRYTKRDALAGAALMVAASVALAFGGVFLGRTGLEAAGAVLKSIAFPVAMTVSMPFWILKGQPWRAQAVIVGGTTVLLVAIGYASTLI